MIFCTFPRKCSFVFIGEHFFVFLILLCFFQKWPLKNANVESFFFIGVNTTYSDLIKSHICYFELVVGQTVKIFSNNSAK